MGNAATCQACGSERALKRSGSNKDLNLHSDFYRAADCASNIDDSLVRGGGRNGVDQICCHHMCLTVDVLKEPCRVNLLSALGM